MGHSDKIEHWLEFTKSKGWKKVSYPGPYEWLANKLTGRECAPSLFWPGWVIGLSAGGFWAAFWGAFMFLTVWHDKTLLQVASPSIACGFCFGIGTMIFHWFYKRKYGLTTWEKFKHEFRSKHN